MSPPPTEFSPEYVAEHSPREAQLYSAMLNSGEPYRSLYRHNLHTGARLGYAHDPASAPASSAVPGLDLQDDSLYYNTAGSARDYWARFALPRPTQSIATLRADLAQWGYCLIREALSAPQLASMQRRIREQAAAERRAGIASWMGSAPAPGQTLPNMQFLHSLINKGEQFVQCVEHDPVGVQAGPVIEQLLGETIGGNFLMSSFIAIITRSHNMPQGLHQDQALAPFQDAAAPFTCNTMFIVDDMGEPNGGTLVVPGSHRLLSAVPSGQPLTEALPPAINLEAPAGTVMIFEGRLLHGSGVNKTEHERAILVMNSIKPFMRQQELHLLSASADLLRRASSKLLYRLGARPQGLGGIEGAWNGDYLVEQRLALEAGRFLPVGELRPDDPAEVLARPFTYRASEVARYQAPHQPETDLRVRDLCAQPELAWQPPEGRRFPRKS